MIRLFVFALALLVPGIAQAHFVEIWPSSPMVHKGDSKDVSLRIAFAHPFKGQLLDMAPPRRLEVVTPDGTVDLSGAMKPDKAAPTRTYMATYKVGKPGDYVFVIDAEPYWEPTEGTYIQQAAKVVLNVDGVPGDWSKPVGLPVEIQPLSRPYALWAGSTFTGRVLVDGKPAPGVEVEVTLGRGSKQLKAASELHNVGVVITDADGVFTYAVPLQGWWGFSALTESKSTLKGPDGKPRPVEQDAVLWIYADSR